MMKNKIDISENPIISQMSTMGHDQILFCSDNETGLKAIIAIHDTTLGPALGGTRMWVYNNELEALHDVFVDSLTRVDILVSLKRKSLLLDKISTCLDIYVF